MSVVNLIRYPDPIDTVYGIQIDDVVVTSITPEGIAYTPLPCHYTIERGLNQDEYDESPLIGQFVRSVMHGYDYGGVVIGVNKHLGHVHIIGTLNKNTGMVCMYIAPLHGIK